MARIRTIKPDLARHEGMFDAEKDTGLPLRFAWAMLPTVCDREGRFEWRPRRLKVELLPYDDLEMSRVLDAWTTRGFVAKYRVGDQWFGWVPTFHRHQVINNRESESNLPSIEEAEEVLYEGNHELPNASGTRQARVLDASGTREVHAQAEGKGREGSIPVGANGGSPADLIWKTGVSILIDAGMKERGARSLLGKYAKQDEGKLAEVISFLAVKGKADPAAYISKAMRGGDDPTLGAT